MDRGWAPVQDASAGAVNAENNTSVAVDPSLLKPGSGRQTSMVGMLIVGGAVALIVVSSLAGALVRSAITPSAQVVVAARDISPRSTIGAQDVTVVSVVRRDLVPGSFSTPNSLTRGGWVADVAIERGQQITSNMLVKQGDQVVGLQPAFLPIPQGFVATSIPSSSKIGVGGFIQAGDYINVIVILDPGQLHDDSGGLVTRTVFTNVHVIRTGAATNEVSGAGQPPGQSKNRFSAGANSLTVVLTQCDAEFMTWFLGHGRVSYTLPAYRDYQPQDLKPDPACPNATTTHGVGPRDIEARWHLTSVAGGRPNLDPTLPGQAAPGG
jgi:pilus assembly protein CpaB